MKSTIIVLSIITGLYFSSCKSNEGEFEDKIISGMKTSNILHYNIIIAPDLSNRILNNKYPKPIKDSEIIGKILNNIYPKILKKGRETNQMDKYSVSFINQGLISLYDVEMDQLCIDFGVFENQKDRIDYIKGRSNSSLEKDMIRFIKEYNRIYSMAQMQTHGADIWTYFNQGIDNLIVKKEENPISFNNVKYLNKFKNILILLTDGYVEAGIYSNEGCHDSNKCYYLSKNRVDAFRRSFKISGHKDLKSFFHESKYGIIPVNNANLNDLEVLVLELYDRSLDTSGNATVHPTDSEIMNLFWEDWLKQSGVKHYELRKVVNSSEDIEKVILNFMNI